MLFWLATSKSSSCWTASQLRDLKELLLGTVKEVGLRDSKYLIPEAADMTCSSGLSLVESLEASSIVG